MRHVLEHERPLLAYVFELAGIRVDLDALIVRSLSDGGMGSLAIAPFEASRRFGSTLSECHFYNANNVPTLVALNADQDGMPFEIDVWRADFSSTVVWPLRSDLVAGPPHPSIEPTRETGSA